MRSLRMRLIVWVVASAMALTAVAGASLYVLARTYLLDEFDESLAHKARLLSSMIKLDYQVLDLEFEDLDMSEFASAEAGGYFQVWLEDESIYRSPTLNQSDLATAEAGRDPAAVNWVDLPDGRRGRGIVYRFMPVSDVMDTDDLPQPAAGVAQSTGMEVTLCLARDAGQITDALRALRLGLVGVGIVLAMVMSLVIGYGVNRGLRPVNTLTTLLSQLDERSLGRKIYPPRLPEELQPIVEQFNGLMERLHLAFERERGFSASIAHELRTPLAGLLTTIEVALAKPRGSDEHVNYLQQLLRMVKQTQTMVVSLLQLAALENGQAEAARQQVQVNDVIRSVWDSVAPAGSVNGRFDLRRSLDAEVKVSTDPALLAVALRNVLHNAVTYVNDGGFIEIASAARDGVAEIRVTNSGSHVAARDAHKVFDRFWRADKARSETGSRFGLGLSIVNHAVEALGGSVRAESADGGNFTILITLPR